MLTNVHAITVSVEYTDLLRLTLPYNRHHFSTFTVVTSNDDFKNVYPIARENNASTFTTNSFYSNGAHFNKWRALEDAITTLNLRSAGWICIMDADVLWPKEISLKTSNPDEVYATKPQFSNYLHPGYLYTPRRLMYPDIPRDISKLPPEGYWEVYPLHRNEVEFAGYSQIFHTSDSALEMCGNCGCHVSMHYSTGLLDTSCKCLKCPSFSWHATNWKHAGGADSFFQQRWNPIRKIRPNFNVLHLGSSGMNWCGRATPYADMSIHPQSSIRLNTLREILAGRRRGMAGPDRFSAEKVEQPPVPLPGTTPETRSGD